MDRARPVLAAHRFREHVAVADRPQCPQNLELLVPNRIRIAACGGLHGHDAQQLQQVILHHVAQRTGRVVELSTPLDPEFLGDRDLHVLDQPATPQRLEQDIAEAQSHQVLHGLFA